MKTGRYRVRKGWFGKAILQAEYNTPSFSGGRVDSSIRILAWEDIPFRYAPAQLSETEMESGT